MTKNIYNQPPITEAVIEIKFAKEYEKSKVVKYIKKVKGLYPGYQELTHYAVDINISTTEHDKTEAQATPQLIYKFSSEDMTQQLVLNGSSFMVAQLAPYCGWNEFFNRFVRDWKLWKKLLGFIEIEHIGVRYINRLDVPVSEGLVDFSEYVNVYPMMPKLLDPQLSYAIQAQIPIHELKSLLSINSAIVKSPLLDYMSLVFDQDIVKTFEPAQNDEEIYSYLNEVHVKKNEIFESSITDKARELFNS